MTQWQGYTRILNASSASGAYSHRLGYFAVGHDAYAPIANTSYQGCKAACDKIDCFGFCFQDEDPAPEHVALCYVKNETTHFQSADLSDSGHCKGDEGVSDCPYNLYRTSGDIGTYWDRVLSNLGSTVPFLDGDKPLLRPGSWAYPDMLEVTLRERPARAHVRTHTRAPSPPPSPSFVLPFARLRDTVG